MKKTLLTGAIAAGAIASGLILQTSSASAVTIARPCGASYTNNVDANPAGTPFNLGCELGTVNNDFVPGGISTTPNLNHQVNKDSMFGFSDWLFAGKDEEEPGSDFLNISSTFPANLLSGDYNLNSIVQPTWTDVMLVLKGPAGGPISPNNYVGYLLAKDSNGGWAGTWKSPFNNSNGPQPNPADVSHISLYYRGQVEVIPTPAAVLPGLIGMGAAVFRKKKQGEEATQEV